MLPLQFFARNKLTNCVAGASGMLSWPVSDQTPLSSAYERTAPNPINAPALESSIRTDVAIVGAGFTGTSTALNLAQRGVSVAVVESKEVGWGGSGRAFGQVVPYAKHHEDHIYSTFGPEYGERLIALLATGPDIVFKLIEDHKIACEPVRTGLLFAAHTKAAAARLEKRAAFWQARSQPVEMLESSSLESVVGSRYYPATLIDYRGGCINPLGFVRGLANVAISAGAQIFENSRATKISKDGRHWRLETERGEVTAESVVLATDGYTDELWPGLKQTIVPVRAYHVLSSPLSENVRKSILPGGQSLTDSRRLYSGIRVRPDGRLHMSIDGPPFSNRGAPFERLATERVRNLFPQTDDLNWEEQIAGWVGISPNQYPRIHKLDEGLFGTVGLSGRGIAFGTLLGGELTKRVLGLPESECALPLTPLRALPSPPLTRLMVHGLINLYRIMDRVELNSGYVRPAS
jgi:glycine/D-amino acid oxidase-like deaminating enzyme